MDDRHRYDVGYALTISTLENATSQKIMDITREIHGVLLDDSVRVKLPSPSISLELNKYNSLPTKQCIGYAANEVVFRISFDNNAKLPSLFRHMDEHKQEIGFSRYGISATTLEEVFRMINKTAIFTREESVSRRMSLSSANPSSGIGNYQPVVIPGRNPRAQRVESHSFDHRPGGGGLVEDESSVRESVTIKEDEEMEPSEFEEEEEEEQEEREKTGTGTRIELESVSKTQVTTSGSDEKEGGKPVTSTVGMVRRLCVLSGFCVVYACVCALGDGKWKRGR